MQNSQEANYSYEFPLFSEVVSNTHTHLALPINACSSNKQPDNFAENLWVKASYEASHVRYSTFFIMVLFSVRYWCSMLYRVPVTITTYRMQMHPVL